MIAPPRAVFTSTTKASSVAAVSLARRSAASSAPGVSDTRHADGSRSPRLDARAVIPCVKAASRWAPATGTPSRARPSKVSATLSQRRSRAEASRAVTTAAMLATEGSSADIAALKATTSVMRTKRWC